MGAKTKKKDFILCRTMCCPSSEHQFSMEYENCVLSSGYSTMEHILFKCYCRKQLIRMALTLECKYEAYSNEIHSEIIQGEGIEVM
jgi:hypothetical protein